MFTVKTKDKVYKIAFRHSLDVVKFTECTIMDEDKKILYIDYATCHPNDNFDRSKGRKISLSRVLQKFNLDRDTRTEIWKEYFNIHTRK
jgi:hypothetical protein